VTRIWCSLLLFVPSMLVV